MEVVLRGGTPNNGSDPVFEAKNGGTLRPIFSEEEFGVGLASAESLLGNLYIQ